MEDTHRPRVPIVERDTIEDEDLQAALAHTDKVGTPPSRKLLAMAHNPELTMAFASYWRLTAEHGQVEHDIKELGRLTIVNLLDCAMCASVQSSLATGISEEEVAAACAMPNFDHPDPRTRAALRYARTLALDDGQDQACYEELTRHFPWSEIIELACFFCLVIGDVRMVKSFGLLPDS